MTTAPGGGAVLWQAACRAADLLAVDPAGLAGAVLAGGVTPARALWLDRLAALDPVRGWLRLPPGTGDEDLLGGIDLPATLAAGRPVRSAGVLARARGRFLVLPMAERGRAGLGARIAAALEAGGGFALIALDEGEAEEAAPPVLAEHLAFALRLSGLALADCAPGPLPDIAAARALLPRVRLPESGVADLVAVAATLGIPSLRAPLLALRAARAAAALAGRDEATVEDLGLAAALVLAPKARVLPAPPETEEPAEPPPPPPDGGDPEEAEDRSEDAPQAMGDVILDAARAALPPDLVARLLAGQVLRGGPALGAGEDGTGLRRGAPVGSRAGRTGDGARIDLIGTLRAAAPWQTIRRALPSGPAPVGTPSAVPPQAGLLPLGAFPVGTPPGDLPPVGTFPIGTVPESTQPAGLPPSGLRNAHSSPAGTPPGATRRVAGSGSSPVPSPDPVGTMPVGKGLRALAVGREAVVQGGGGTLLQGSQPVGVPAAADGASRPSSRLPDRAPGRDGDPAAGGWQTGGAAAGNGAALPAGAEARGGATAPGADAVTVPGGEGAEAPGGGAAAVPAAGGAAVAGAGGMAVPGAAGAVAPEGDGADTPGAGGSAGRVLVRPSDIRIRRFRQRTERVLILAVDASGSAAVARLAETKGAVELILGAAYVQRLEVALIAFRGAGAEVILPPTRSLVQAKRRLSGLPGGGGTPLAAGLAAGLGLAVQVKRRGRLPALAILTDGRGNIALDGKPGREAAVEDARRMARLIRAAGFPAIVIDTGARPQREARELAAAMGTACLALPQADARRLAGLVGIALGTGT